MPRMSCSKANSAFGSFQSFSPRSSRQTRLAALSSTAMAVKPSSHYLSDVLASADVELVIRKEAVCFSSCAILAALANGRTVVSRKADVGVHLVYDVRNGKPTYEGLEDTNRLLAEALRKAGVTDAFVERMMN